MDSVDILNALNELRKQFPASEKYMYFINADSLPEVTQAFEAMGYHLVEDGKVVYRLYDNDWVEVCNIYLDRYTDKLEHGKIYAVPEPADQFNWTINY